MEIIKNKKNEENENCISFFPKYQQNDHLQNKMIISKE